MMSNKRPPSWNSEKNYNDSKAVLLLGVTPALCKISVKIGPIVFAWFNDKQADDGHHLIFKIEGLFF